MATTQPSSRHCLLYPKCGILMRYEVSSAIIVYHCLSNIWALFEPQIRKVLIINNFKILHRQVETDYQ